MNANEFHVWLKGHLARFPGVMSWLAKIPESSPPGLPSRSDVLGAWAEQLSDLSLADAQAASRDLSLQGESEQPKAFDRHPAAILTLVRRARGRRQEKPWRPKIIDGQETFDCPVCEDHGGVFVYHNETIAAVRRGEDPIITTDAALCNCEAGRGRGAAALKYDPRRMIRAKLWLSHDEHVEAILNYFCQAMEV